MSVTSPDGLKARLARADRWAYWAARAAVGMGLLWLGLAHVPVDAHWPVLTSWGAASAAVWWVVQRSQAGGMRLVLHSACPSLHAGCCAAYDMERCSVGGNRDYARRRSNADRRGILLPPVDDRWTANDQ